MWKLSIEDDQGEKTSVNLVRDEYTIGRAETNTIRLTERNISREHARLFRDRDSWYLADQDSYNGAYVNGARVVDPVRVAHGDLIQLGDYRLEVVDEAIAVSRTHPTMRDGLATTTGRRDTLVNQPDRFVMVVGPAPGTEYPLTGNRMVVGRGEECDISINHASVSRVHAEVHAIADGRYELIDKGSANGVRVNAVELQRALIDARDNIELGDVILKYVPAGDIYVPGADESQKLAAGQIAGEAFPPTAETIPVPQFPAAVKFGAILLALGLIVVLVMLLMEDGGTRSASTSTAIEPATPTVEPQPEVVSAAPVPENPVLVEAESLLEDGDVFGAHAKLLELPPDSEAKNQAVYTRIESSWADAIIEAATAEKDHEAKRKLLQEVVSSEGVDAERKSHASRLLEELAQKPRTPPRSQVPLQPAPQPPVPKPKQPPTKTSPSRSTPPPPAGKDDNPTLVRDDPFGQ